MDSRPARAARGMVAAGVSTLIAAVSHAAGGGVFPHPMLLLAGFVFSGLFCVALVGRRPSLGRSVPSVLASQLLFHLIFSTAGGTVVSTASGHGHHAGHHGSVLMSSTDAPLASLDGAMLAAHAAAAVVTIAALRFGEVAFWGLLDTARLMMAALLRFLTPILTTSSRAHSVPVTEVGVAPIPVEFLTRPRYRGPPVAGTAS